MKGKLREWGNLLSPRPLLHKCVEEREKTRMAFLHEPAMQKG
jgi:hypothetical protein